MVKRAFKSVIFAILLFSIILFGTFLVSCKKIPIQNIIDDEDYTPKRTVTQTKVVTYDGPSIMTTSSKVEITVENEELFVYETLVNHRRLFTFSEPTTTAPVAIFDFEGSVTVSVTVKDEASLTSAVVRPLEYNITPTISGNVITFQLNYSDNYVIEYNGESNTAIHLFANPLETNAPDPQNIPENMIYIGPGVYKANAIPVTSGTTVYIAGGAVVYGQIRADSVENLTIRGRGIIDGSIFPRTKDSEYTLPIEIRNSSNITIEDLAFLNPAGWAITSYFCNDVNINNIKIITARGNGDGISLQSSSNVTVKGGFVRTWDDSLVIKNRDRGNTAHILFDGVTVWTDLAQSMEIGYETNGEKIEDVTFKNITVLHNFHKPAMSIHNSDDADISDILYQNITIEDAQMLGDNQSLAEDDFLIEMNIAFHSIWTKSQGNRGTISNVIFDNIKVLKAAPTLTVNMAGYDNNKNIDNVLLSNVKIVDTAVTNAQTGKLNANKYVNGISYAYQENKLTGAKQRLPYILNLNANDTPQITTVETITQDGFIVPEFAISQAPIPYVGAKVTGEFSAAATRGVGSIRTAPYDDGSGSYDTAENPAVNGIDGDKNTVWKSKDWTDVENDQFVAYTITFDAAKFVGNIRIFGESNSNLSILQKISVFAKFENETFFDRLEDTQNCEFSPSNNNYTDIKIAAGKYDAIQLRIFKTSSNGYARLPFLAEVEFYPPSLTYNKTVIASAHEDVYKSSSIVDGNNNTYYESSKGIFPASITVDMNEIYNIKYINLHLPPLMTWEPRTQTIEILVSINGTDFTSVLASAPYTFDATTGNMVGIVLETPVAAKCIKLIYTSNTAIGGWGAQLSEIYVFE